MKDTLIKIFIFLFHDPTKTTKTKVKNWRYIRAYDYDHYTGGWYQALAHQPQAQQNAKFESFEDVHNSIKKIRNLNLLGTIYHRNRDGKPVITQFTSDEAEQT